MDNMFSYHYIKRNLITIWLKYLKLVDKRTPLWVPTEVINIPIDKETEERLTYIELLEVLERERRF